MKIRPLLLATSLLFVATSVSAWNGRGHMIVAAVAWEHLSPAAKARAAELLKLNPTYALWIKGVKPDLVDQYAFVTAATWPDLIKSAKGYHNDGEHPSGEGAAQNIGYADHLQHRYWHFVDTPFAAEGDDTPLQNAKEPDANTQIETFRTAIASSTASDDVKSYDMVWLEHLVGDVHQRLHSTSRFSHALPDGDEGGNKVCLNDASCDTELHAYWDDVLGLQKSKAPASVNAAAAIEIASMFPPALATEAADDNDVDWINESFQLAQHHVYADPIKDGAGPYTLTPSYEADAKNVATAQVELAGERLANLLNVNLH